MIVAFRRAPRSLLKDGALAGVRRPGAGRRQHPGAADRLGPALAVRPDRPDTFFVRTLLVPSIVQLLGLWHWWPSQLGRASVGTRDQAAEASLPRVSTRRSDVRTARGGFAVDPRGDESRVRAAARRDEAAVVANEHLTAVAGAALLALIIVELATLPDLGALLSVHIFVGVLLAGPLLVKLGSTGYRFLSYYAGSPAFVRRGRPHPALRLVAPLLIASTLTLVGSGIGLLLTGPGERVLVDLHVVSFLAWLAALALHVAAHVPRVPRLIADDWLPPAGESTSGRWRRAVAVVVALGAGAAAATAALPLTARWVPHVGNGLSHLVAGIAVAALAFLAARPLRWRRGTP